MVHLTESGVLPWPIYAGLLLTVLLGVAYECAEQAKERDLPPSYDLGP